MKSNIIRYYVCLGNGYEIIQIRKHYEMDGFNRIHECWYEYVNGEITYKVNHPESILKFKTIKAAKEFINEYKKKGEEK